MSIHSANRTHTFDFENSLRVISNILIPTDFSPASWNATQIGLEISRLNSHASLSFLHIYPVTSKYVDVGKRKTNDEELDRMRSRMNQLSHSLSISDNENINIDNVVLSGNVDEIIAQFMHENQFDLVIVGINSNGQNNDIGSHTVKLIKESGVPVMIVPNRSDNGNLTD